ncbi:hypothetical protein ACONVD_002948, partial [Escherichia coli]
MLKMSAPMSLAEIDNDIFLQRINASITRVRFALQSYENFKQFVRIELDSAVQAIEENSNKLNFDLTEDQLTLILLANIKNKDMGIEAYHENNQRGHCDITIKLNRFTWHGEAKKHTGSYSYLFKGYAQLTERYSTGTVDSASGGLIIYTRNKKCNEMMTKWKAHLDKSAPRIHACKSISITPCKRNPLVFYSQHTHTVS